MTDDPDELIPLTQIAGCFPGRGGRPHMSPDTAFRWSTRGVRGVRLQTMLVGGRRMTRRRWVDEFLAALNSRAA